METEDFFLRDYELKVEYLTRHFERMWTRFNFFVTIESALIGGNSIFGEGKHPLQIAALGCILSFIWYIFGAEDRYLVRVYRKHMEDAAERVAHLVWTDNATHPAYLSVGEIERTARELRLRDTDQRNLSKLVEHLSGWRIELISTTKLAALFPLFVFLIWLGTVAELLWKYHHLTT